MSDKLLSLDRLLPSMMWAEVVISFDDALFPITSYSSDIKIINRSLCVVRQASLVIILSGDKKVYTEICEIGQSQSLEKYHLSGHISTITHSPNGLINILWCSRLLTTHVTFSWMILLTNEFIELCGISHKLLNMRNVVLNIGICY